MSLFSEARTHMIDCQLRVNDVNDERVISAVEAVAREKFVPKSKQAVAYVDGDIQLGENRALMEPMVFGRLLVAADIQPKDLVLDVGCATGYSAAVIAGLADAVVALESDTDMAAKAETILAEQEIMNVAVVTGDLCKGVAKQGPYDVIFIEGVVERVPVGLLNQLAENGRLITVQDDGGVGRVRKFVKTADGVETTTLFDATIPPCPGFENNKGFVF